MEPDDLPTHEEDHEKVKQDVKEVSGAVKKCVGNEGPYLALDDRRETKSKPTCDQVLVMILPSQEQEEILNQKAAN